MSNTAKLVLSVILCVSVGALGSIVTAPEIQGWYSHLLKPSWNPPNWLFAPVWTALYILMGIALSLIWKAGANNDVKQWAVLVFAVQLALNFLWSYIFFHEHLPGWAFVEIVVLWLLILCCIIAVARINRVAAWLLVPYISWVSFAAVLNYAVWKLNSWH